MTTRQAIVTGTSRATAARLAAGVRRAAKRAAAADPVVRGADWRMATVATVGTDGTITTADGIKARRLASYLNPALGDLIIISQSGSGNWLAAGLIATAADTAWTAYTPTWIASTTAPSIGNGTLIGRYQRVGRTVSLVIDLTAGSTTTFGGGNYSFTLPFVSANAGAAYIGDVQMLQSGRWPGQFVVTANQNNGSPFLPISTTTSTLNTLTPTTPVTLTSSTQIRISITYESAT